MHEFGFEVQRRNFLKRSRASKMPQSRNRYIERKGVWMTSVYLTGVVDMEVLVVACVVKNEIKVGSVGCMATVLCTVTCIVAMAVARSLTR